jgi:predicted RND superfamily exporter protein
MIWSGYGEYPVKSRKKTGEEMRKLIEIVIKHNVIVLSGAILFALPFFIWAPFVKTVDNVDYFTVENNDETKFYDQLKKTFGNDEFFIIAFQKENQFTHDNLNLLQHLTMDLEGIEEVREVKSLANVEDIIGRENDFEIKKFLEVIPETPEKLEALKSQALSNPLYVNTLISRDGKTAAIVLFPFERPGNENFRKELTAKCEAVLDSYRIQGMDFSIAGWTVTNLYLSQYLKSDMAVFIPLTYLFIILCVYFFFRSIQFTFLALLNITICLGSTMGLFYLTGTALNNVTAIVPPLIMALSLCDTVHIFSHMDKRILERLGDKKKALHHVLQSLFMPCFLTSFTTILGFISLYISDIPPIREFALMASAGMLFEFFFSFFFMAPLMLFFPQEMIFIDYGRKDWMTGLVEGINQYVKKFSKVFFTAGLLLMIVSILLASGIKVETNLLDFFKPESPVRTSLSKIEKHLGGIQTLDISLTGNGPDVFKNPDSLHVIESIQTFLAGQKGVDVTLSFVDFLKDIHQSFHNEDPAFYAIPESGELVSQYMLIYDSDEIDDFVTRDFSHARISARIHEYSSAEQGILIDTMRQFIRGMDTRGLDVKVSGRAVQDVNTMDALVWGQVSSLSLAAVIIFIVLFLMLRSFKIGCLSIVPNLFPLLLNFGIMGALAIPLNTATALISAVAIGIAVDDTIHFLFDYKVQRESGRDIPEAIERVFKRKGRAIISSSLILFIGFGVMIFSRFVPIVHFSLLSAAIMVTALIGDVVFLPSMLYAYSDLKSPGISYHKKQGNRHAE